MRKSAQSIFWSTTNDNNSLSACHPPSSKPSCFRHRLQPALCCQLSCVLQAMGAMNKQMNLPELSNIMREFDRQNERMEMTSEMMGDAVDDAFEVCDLCIITHCPTQDKRLLVPPYQSSAANKCSHQMHAVCFATYSLTSGHPVRPYALMSGTLPKHAWHCFAHADKYMHSVLLSMPD